MIYQYNQDLQIIAEYSTLKETERITGICERTVSSAICKGGLCRGKWYFARKTDFIPVGRIRGEKAGKKFVVTLTDDIWDRLLVAIGQRKKQDIFRELLKNWIESQNGKH